MSRNHPESAGIVRVSRLISLFSVLAACLLPFPFFPFFPFSQLGS